MRSETYLGYFSYCISGTSTF